jgi:hypothetical protein
VRRLVIGLVVTVARPAIADGFLQDWSPHLSLSGGGGLAHGVAGGKIELRVRWIAAFGLVGLVGASGDSPGLRYGLGARVYLFEAGPGVGFVSVEYAQAKVSSHDLSCCEWFETKEANLGGVLGYRFLFQPGYFFEVGIGPAWNWSHSRGVSGGFTVSGYYDNGAQVAFGLTKEIKAPNFDLALGFEW